MAWQEYPNLPQTEDNSKDIIKALFACKETFFQFQNDVDP